MTAAGTGMLLVVAAVKTHNVGLLVGALLVAGGALTALMQAVRLRRRPPNRAASAAAIGVLAGLTLAGALTCLLALLSGLR